MKTTTRRTLKELPVFTSSELHILIALYRLGAFDRANATWLRQLTRTTGKSFLAVSDAVKRLRKKGLAQEQTVKQENYVIKKVWLTDSGRELAELLTRLTEDP